MDKSCSNCQFSENCSFEQPCSICVVHSHWTYKIPKASMAPNSKKKCSNCACFSVPTNQHPCSYCVGYSGWLSKGDKKEANMIQKEVFTFAEWEEWESRIWKEKTMSTIEHVVMVQFEKNYGWSKEYVFKTNLDLEVGDDVIVDVTGKGATLAKVSKVNDVSAAKATRWVIQKVNYEENRARIVREAKLKALKERMQSRCKVLEEHEIYVYWAEKDPEMARLIDVYNILIANS